MPSITETYCAVGVPGYSCNLDRIHEDAALISDPIIDFSDTDRVILVLHNIYDWAGTAGGQFSTDEKHLDKMITIAAPYLNLKVLMHEFGHSYGLRHAGIWDCPSTSVPRDLTKIFSDGVS